MANPHLEGALKKPGPASHHRTGFRGKNPLSGGKKKESHKNT
jgi:hypothetical protein